jgi:hypothetical protein
MPYFKLSEVAQRMDANESWLRNRINEDRRSSNPQLQFHHYIGTSPVWTLEAFESLRNALAGELHRRRRYRGTGRPAKGWSHAPQSPAPQQPPAGEREQPE